ncbi:MAG TPA: hypothetical protein VKA03_02515 [Methylovirgula sp.]|nr:hypothetical protein [Methylovirgula sp.]
MTPAKIVAAYIQNRRRCARSEADEFQRLASIEVAIEHAALCHFLPDCKRHPHQRRIPGALLKPAERKLQGIRSKLTRAKTFDEVHALVDEAIGNIRGIGELTIYDIAHRIGAFLDKEPTRVYLHAGTRAGARLMGFTGTSLDPTQLPPAFSRLTAAEIEDCLCIYREDLREHRSCARPLQRANHCASPSQRSKRPC